MAANLSLVDASALFWLIPLVGAIFVLYLLKMRRKELQVPASFLWPKLTNEIRANSLFQRPKVTILMILQLLAATLLIAAFARPQVRSESVVGQTTILVLDASASMGATDVKPSRLEEAVRVANKFVDAVRPGDKLGAIEAGPNARVIFPLSDDPGKMRQSLTTVRSYDSPGDVGEALRLAASLVGKSESGKIVLLSDGVFGDVPNFTPGKAELVFHKIGVTGENTAITALGISDSNSRPELYCGLKNYGRAPCNGVLNIYADGALINSLKVEVPGKSTIGKTLPAPPGAKVVEARLDDGDALQADNYAAVVRDSQSISVLLVSPGDLFLERALSLDPRVTLFKSPSVPQTGKYDIVVFDGVQESPVEAPGVLTFGSAGPNSPVTALGDSPNSLLKQEQEDDPLLRGVNLEKLYLGKSQMVKVKPDAKVLAEGTSGPLIVQRKRHGRQIYVSFSPLDSDFPLRVGFPIFIDNAISFLAPREAGSSSLTAQAGRNLAFPAGPGDLKLKHPDGSESSIRQTNGQYVVRELGKVGRYEVETVPPKAIYVTFGSEAQSSIAPVDKPSLGGHRPASTDVSSRLADWWKPLVMVALLILGVEWFAFARRS